MALLVMAAGCTVTPIAERPPSPLPGSIVPAATAGGVSEPPAQTATASPPAPSIETSTPPSMAPPTAVPPDPLPTLAAIQPASLASGPLRIDGLARVVGDRLRVRSAPGTGADSERLEPLLDAGTMLFIIDGPVAGSGYEWYQIAPATFGNGGDQGEFRYKGEDGPVGWVASADREGTPWIAGARAECPDLAASSDDLSVLERLGPLVALSCYGDTTIQFRAKLGGRTFVDGFSGEAGPDPLYPDTYWRTPQSTELDALFGSVLEARFPSESSVSVWNVVGHFDDKAAATCLPWPRFDAQSIAVAILECRTTFVVTDLVPTDAA